MTYPFFDFVVPNSHHSSYSKSELDLFFSQMFDIMYSNSVSNPHFYNLIGDMKNKLEISNSKVKISPEYIFLLTDSLFKFFDFNLSLVNNFDFREKITDFVPIGDSIFILSQNKLFNYNIITEELTNTFSGDLINNNVVSIFYTDTFYVLEHYDHLYHLFVVDINNNSKLILSSENKIETANFIRSPSTISLDTNSKFFEINSNNSTFLSTHPFPISRAHIDPHRNIFLIHNGVSLFIISRLGDTFIDNKIDCDTFTYDSKLLVTAKRNEITFFDLTDPLHPKKIRSNSFPFSVSDIIKIKNYYFLLSDSYLFQFPIFPTLNRDQENHI